MKFIGEFIILGYILIFVKGSEDNDLSEVKMLHVIFRHGEKVPHIEFQSYPRDPHINHSFYPIGNGGLTNEGKRQEYKIGKLLRKKYNNFFGRYYSGDKIDARSSAVPRTQMSLQLVLAGLYPPDTTQIWNPNLLWQPVITSFEPQEKDLIFFPQECALYKNEYRNYLADENTAKLIEPHKETMEYLTINSGKIINTTEDVYYLYNLFKEEELQNLNLPDWTSKVYPNPMKNITILDFNLRSATTKLKRLGAGHLLRKITEDMKDLCYKSDDLKKQKAFLFSGHEDNVARLVRALGTNDPLLPDYGSTIIIETLQYPGKNESYFVKVLMWPGASGSGESFIPQTIPGCDEICPLKEFLKILRDVIPDEYESKCCIKSKNIKKNYSSNNSSLKNISLFIITFSIVINIYHIIITN